MQIIGNENVLDAFYSVRLYYICLFFCICLFFQKCFTVFLLCLILFGFFTFVCIMFFLSLHLFYFECQYLPFFWPFQEEFWLTFYSRFTLHLSAYFLLDDTTPTEQTRDAWQWQIRFLSPPAGVSSPLSSRAPFYPCLPSHLPRASVYFRRRHLILCIPRKVILFPSLPLSFSQSIHIKVSARLVTMRLKIV